MKYKYKLGRTLSKALESKDHLIKRLKNVSDEDKIKLTDYFKKNPHQESKIDWNKVKTLNIDDFKDIMSQKSKTKSKKESKEEGSELVFENENVKVYKILSHGTCQLYGKNTKWCITQDNPSYWKDYFNNQRLTPYFIINKNLENDHDLAKVAVMVNDDNKIDSAWNNIDENDTIWNNKEYVLDKKNIRDIDDLIYVLDIDKNIFKHRKFSKIEELYLDESKIKSINGKTVYEDDLNLKRLVIDYGIEIGNDLRKFSFIDVVDGDFDCSGLDLDSLRGCPRIVNSYFYCSDNNLKTLKYHPIGMNGAIEANDNNIENLDDFNLDSIGTGLDTIHLDYNKLTNIDKLFNHNFEDIFAKGNNIREVNIDSEYIEGLDLSFNENLRKINVTDELENFVKLNVDGTSVDDFLFLRYADKFSRVLARNLNVSLKDFTIFPEDSDFDIILNNTKVESSKGIENININKLHGYNNETKKKEPIPHLRELFDV